MSSNDAWRGRRFKTPEYMAFAHHLWLMLPRKMEIPEGRLQIRFVFGVSSVQSDYDNMIKQAQDVISSKYGFNDNRIFRGIIDKVIVPKGQEFIEFEISALPQAQEKAA